jgi:hypothetical protein
LPIRTLRSLEVAQSVARHIQIKQRQRGYDEATFVESFILLNGVGGDCLDDFEHLRADRGLAEMLGPALPSPEAARNFLMNFTARPTWRRPNSRAVWARSPIYRARMQP